MGAEELHVRLSFIKIKTTIKTKPNETTSDMPLLIKVEIQHLIVDRKYVDVQC